MQIEGECALRRWQQRPASEHVVTGLSYFAFDQQQLIGKPFEWQPEWHEAAPIVAERNALRLALEFVPSMFYLSSMQATFDFAADVAADDVAFMRRALADFFGPLEPFDHRIPIWQLVRSLISSQTHDRVTEAALKRLMWRWPEPAEMAASDPQTVLRYIDEVAHAKAKAEQLVATMQWIGRERPSFDLGFLREWPLRDALDWLERFPGVGPKVAAATLNASTLAMPVFIVDSHVHRILLRFGLIGARATAEQGREAVTAALPDAGKLLDLFVRMKRLGQQVCRPVAPHCEACPLAARCRQKTALGRPQEEPFMLRAPANAAFKSRRNAPKTRAFPGGPRSRVPIKVPL